MRRNTRADKRALWMARYEELVTAAVPALRGRLDWDTAAYHYLEGRAPEDAAARIIARAKAEPSTS